MSRPVKKCTELSYCRSCNAEIYWCTTHAGKNMPVDAKPDPSGELVVTHKPGENRLEVGKYYEPKHGPREKWKFYTSHFATCPKAGEHRR